MDIKVEGISKRFGKKQVLRDLSFTASAGQCIGILGENGSGKSTLFGVLTGLQKGSGSFWFDGVDLMRDPKTRAKRVGFVPQSPPLFGELTAQDNLRLWYDKSALKQELQNGRLKMLGIDEFLSLSVDKLSGGMKKRLAIGCAIAHHPPLLLLDEPCSALDLLCKEQIYAYLRDYTRQGGTVVMATHDVYELAFCDVVYILRDGRLHRYDGDRQIDCLVAELKNG